MYTYGNHINTQGTGCSGQDDVPQNTAFLCLGQDVGRAWLLERFPNKTLQLYNKNQMRQISVTKGEAERTHGLQPPTVGLQIQPLICVYA
jgi:hypothetical protein